MTAPFFVVGNDRSGTTMLRLVLDRSRGAAIPPESMFLLDFAPAWRAGRLGDPATATRLLRRVWAHPRVEHWGLPPEPPPLPPGLSHAAAYRFVVEAPFRAYARAHGKERFGDKTPVYLHHVDHLLEVWPDARFLVLVRDGRDVALSLLRVPFGANNVWAAARWWARGIRAGREAERRHPERVLALRYEDLVAAPAAGVRRACEFLGLAYEDSMLAIEETDPGKIAKDQAGWFTNVFAGINASAVGKWEREMSEHERRVFAAVAGAELRALGYEPGPVRRIPPGRVLGYALHDAVARGVNFVRLRLLRERGREVGYVLRRKLGLT